jgi:hypothetical protein
VNLQVSHDLAIPGAHPAYDANGGTMKSSLTPAAVLVCMSLAACGGGTSSKTVAAPTRFPTSGPDAPCSVLGHHDVLVAFGTAKPVTHVLPGRCVYTAGSFQLQVTTRQLPPDQAAATGKQLGTRQPRLTVIEGAGYVGQAREIIAAGTVGAQSEMTLLKGSKLITFVMTNSSRSSASMLKRVLRLGRVAAK